MPMMDSHLRQVFPTLAERLPKLTLADLPTRLEESSLYMGNRKFPVLVKHDEETSSRYGGNKIRKLEYLLQRARRQNAERVATFGTIASNHALATSLHATKQGFACTCLLSHQTKCLQAALALKMHLQCGTEIISLGGSREERVATMRRHLQGRNIALIPMGGSNWLGAAAYVEAGLELAGQIADNAITAPDRLYVATGTMATTVGIALGLAAAGMATEVHAIRVTHTTVANRDALQRLLTKTVTLMNRLDPTVPKNLVEKSRIIFRDEFFGSGYAHPTTAGEHAVEIAADQWGLALETTYTGKALAALLYDLQQPGIAGKRLLFWNTYAAKNLPVSAERPDDTSGLPAGFQRYFD